MSIFARVIGSVGLCYTYQVYYLISITKILYAGGNALWGSTIDKSYYILPDEGAILICIRWICLTVIECGDDMIVVNALCMGGLWCGHCGGLAVVVWD